MNLINWIDKKEKEINETKEFREFFSEFEIKIIEHDRYLFNCEKGIDIVMSESMMIHSIHLFSGNTIESKRFEGKLLNNISFEMNQLDINKKLGKPNKNGGGYHDIFGNVPYWNKYYFETYSLHLQYSPTSGNIDIITIGSLKLEPYLNSSSQ